MHAHDHLCHVLEPGAVVYAAKHDEAGAPVKVRAEVVKSLSYFTINTNKRSYTHRGRETRWVFGRDHTPWRLHLDRPMVAEGTQPDGRPR